MKRITKYSFTYALNNKRKSIVQKIDKLKVTISTYYTLNESDKKFKQLPIRVLIQMFTIDIIVCILYINVH